MLQAPIPPDDTARLQELRSYGVLDSPDEPSFDDIGALVRDIARPAPCEHEQNEWGQDAHGGDPNCFEARSQGE